MKYECPGSSQGGELPGYRPRASKATCHWCGQKVMTSVHKSEDGYIWHIKPHKAPKCIVQAYEYGLQEGKVKGRISYRDDLESGALTPWFCSSEPSRKFFNQDFPNMASHCPQSQCGYSVYRDVLIQWDEDHDDRILSFVKDLPIAIRYQLAICQEHEGTLALRWYGHTIPHPFSKPNYEVKVCEDIWVTESKLLS